MSEKDIKLLEAIIFASAEPVEENDLKEKINDKKKYDKIFKSDKRILQI